MSNEKALIQTHPEGELQMEGTQAGEIPLSLDTFAGKVQFRWVPEAEVSSLGQMPFFIEFLKTSGVFENWVNDCPLQYTSPNAPQKRDVLGTILLSVLAGHWRYAHISALRGDGVKSRVARDDEGGQRGFGAPRLVGHEGRRNGTVAEETPESQL